jgi:hypothetical protein
LIPIPYVPLVDEGERCNGGSGDEVAVDDEHEGVHAGLERQLGQEYHPHREQLNQDHAQRKLRAALRRRRGSRALLPLLPWFVVRHVSATRAQSGEVNFPTTTIEGAPYIIEFEKNDPGSKASYMEAFAGSFNALKNPDWLA